jgi:hypothetical protein
MFEDELKEANECNSILAAQLLQVKTKLAEESRLKDDKFLLLLFSCHSNHIWVYSGLITTLLCKIP